ncbi:lytic transglycosylase domain-containing protein [Hansschlegelia quercus]|uniref:Lytic transglycosylase domain-containing protein n=1 Tax=Hansschlegelia quercus TaxID=2528245 RepID=A0A4Q9GJA8_9HYPH|nr:transglycosylase SLT domain-containing protein [Hansschlegelia quercus]TBN52538.1 lytic transglycosylase domain-containing protein [Hansschlegelia quercus]
MRSVLLAGLLAAAVSSVPVAAEEPAPQPAVAEAAPAPAPAPAPDSAPTADEQALRTMVRNAAVAENLPPEIAEAVADVESGFNPRAVGGVGEIGLMQVLPSTARMLGFSEPLPKLFEPETNVRYGVRYLASAWRKTGADICATVMKYRAGHGETRYSQRSVAYCVRVRQLLAERGFKVTGTVPVATFGAPAASGVFRGARRLSNGRVRMAFNWRTVDLRRKALDKAGGAGLRIAE